MLTSPVLQVQKQSGAVMVEAHGWELPRRYSSLAEEYRACTEAVGLVDRSYTGRLQASGKDALDLLNRLSTNKLADLSAWRGMHTVLTTPKGRIVDLLFVLCLPDSLLVVTSPETRQKVMEWVDFYTFSEEVSMKDVTGTTAMLGLTGPRAGDLLDRMTRQKASALAPGGSMCIPIGGADAIVARSDFLSLPGYDIMVPAQEGVRVWKELLDWGSQYGIRPVGMEALEAVRVERGVPLYGRELGEDFNPLEAGLIGFVSFSKGCYVGQEVVARLNTYKKVQKRLMGLSWGSDSLPPTSARLLLDGRQVGVLTSVACSPRLRGIALGYVRREVAQPGGLVTIETIQGEIAARLEELPFKP